MVHLDRIEHRSGRIFEHVRLSDARLGSTEFTVNLPDPLPADNYPWSSCSAGWERASTTSELLAMPATTLSSAMTGGWHRRPAPRMSCRLPELRAQVLSIPGQVTAALHWLVDQPWSDRDRVALVGFSLGSVAAPAVQHVAMGEGIPIGSTALAYGAAPIEALMPRWARPLACVLRAAPADAG